MSPTYHILSKQEIGVHQLSTTLQRNCKRRQQRLHSPRSWIFIDFDADSFKDWSILDNLEFGILVNFGPPLMLLGSYLEQLWGWLFGPAPVFNRLRRVFRSKDRLPHFWHQPPLRPPTHPTPILINPLSVLGCPGPWIQNPLLILINPISTKIHIKCLTSIGPRAPQPYFL